MRRESSSGGIFTFLAEQIIDKGGVVFGAKWNDRWEVVHDFTVTKEGLKAFRGSKYVQSRIGSSYIDAERFLKENRVVLFSGTPCQIAALKLFLREDYFNLLTVDFICHGVPSPGVFRQYMQEQLNSYDVGGCVSCIPERLNVPKGVGIKKILFRDKTLGWKKFSMAYELNKECNESDRSVVISYSKPLNKDPFLRGFLRDLYLRPSCHACPSKELKSGSDFTIGDFWGIEKYNINLDDDRGVSALLINNDRYLNLIKGLQIHAIPYSFLCRVNPAIIRSSKIPKQRTLFWNDKKNGFSEKVVLICKPSALERIKKILKLIIRRK